MVANTIILPHNYTPRDYQLPFLKAMDSGIKRAVGVWHRRSGKDLTYLNMTAKKMFERVGTYYYYFPTQILGRKIIWDGMDREGRPFLEAFPKEAFPGRKNDIMQLKAQNGSIFQIIGTDRLDVVGTNPIGTVFSEFSLQNPKGWEYVRPILAENGGWAAFNFTPRGYNHAKDIYDMAKDNPKWFCSLLTVDDTHAVTKQAIEDERDAGMTDAMIQQEFYCSFELGLEGAYYAQIIAELRRKNQITSVPHDPSCQVFTSWDLGFDCTSIWFFQLIGHEIHVIDYYGNTGKSIDFYAEIIRSRKEENEYKYGRFYMPHDANKREMISNTTLVKSVEKMGYDVIGMERELNVDFGINRVMQTMPRCWFDAIKCEEGIVGLMNYRREYNETLRVYMEKPVHDWACLIAGTMISTDQGDVPIERVATGDYVKTPTGFKKVTFSGKVKQTKQLLEIHTNRGRKLTCTPEHKIFFNNYVDTADALSYGSVLFNNSILRNTLWKQLHSTDTSLGFKEAILQGLGRKHCTKPFGSTTMGRFQTNTKYIIKTAMLRIMLSKTWNYLQKKNMISCTPNANIKNGWVRTATKNSLNRPDQKQMYGMHHQRARNFIRLLANIHGGIENDLLGNVTFATKNTNVHTQGDQTSAQTTVNQQTGGCKVKTGQSGRALFAKLCLRLINTVRPERVVRVVQLNCEAKPRDVYDLTVKDDHCYYANGLLVSNSHPADSFRYMTKSLTKVANTRDQEKNKQEWIALKEANS